MRIAFVSRLDPFNKIVRSGVPYSIFNELSKDNVVDWVFPEHKSFIEQVLFAFGVLLERVLNLFGRNMIYNSFVSRAFCHSVQKKLKKHHYDCVFTMGAMTTAYLNTSLPVFCRADSIAPSMENYYYFNVPKFASKMTKAMERRALHRYTRFFSPSQWVMDEIKKFVPMEPDDKLILIETGANLDDDYIHYKKHTYSLTKKINILLVGYDLKRKGVDVAFEATKALKENYALDACLVIMGGEPEKEILNTNFVRYVGKKDKNDKKQFDEFYQEFANADLFVFPTKAECHGIVNCEAAAYGLPIFSYQTGGVPSYCIDSVNGRCLPMSSSGLDFAKVIFEAIKNGSMDEYSVASRKLYEEKFNWRVWGQRVRKEMTDVMKKRSSCPN